MNDCIALFNTGFHNLGIPIPAGARTVEWHLNFVDDIQDLPKFMYRIKKKSYPFNGT